tara:strand:+ start:56 stop:1426 length:1371 start_codon:yes stop_codon:yes gene_type:complete
MKPFDFIVTLDYSDKAHIARPMFDDQTLELSRSLARAGFKTLLIEMYPWSTKAQSADIPEADQLVFDEIQTHQNGVWGSLQTLKIINPRPGRLGGPFQIISVYSKSKFVQDLVSKHSSRITTLITTGPEGAFFHKIKNKKRSVYFQTPDALWPLSKTSATTSANSSLATTATQSNDSDASNEPSIQLGVTASKHQWHKVSYWLSNLIFDPRRVAQAMAIHRSFEIIYSNTHQYNRLSENFFIPSHKGKLALPTVNPYVTKNSKYEQNMGQNSILFISETPMGSGLDILLETWASQEVDWRIKNPLIVVSRVKKSTNLYQAIEDLKTQGLEYIDLEELDHNAVTELILGSRLVVIPSRVEEFGGFHLWALALGANLLTTMVGVLPELIGQEAIIVEAGQSESLANILPRVLSEDVKESLYDRRREFVWGTFDSQTRAQIFVDLFQAPERMAGVVIEE